MKTGLNNDEILAWRTYAAAALTSMRDIANITRFADAMLDEEQKRRHVRKGWFQPYIHDDPSMWMYKDGIQAPGYGVLGMDDGTWAICGERAARDTDEEQVCYTSRDSAMDAVERLTAKLPRPA